MKHLLILFLGLVPLIAYTQDIEYESDIVVVQFDSGINHKTDLLEFNQLSDYYEVFSIERRFPFLDLVEPTEKTRENLLALRRSYTVKFNANIKPKEVAHKLNAAYGITYAEPKLDTSQET